MRQAKEFEMGNPIHTEDAKKMTLYGDDLKLKYVTLDPKQFEWPDDSTFYVTKSSKSDVKDYTQNPEGLLTGKKVINMSLVPNDIAQSMLKIKINPSSINQLSCKSLNADTDLPEADTVVKLVHPVILLAWNQSMKSYHGIRIECDDFEPIDINVTATTKSN